jgi:dUTP pyrophosphatase
MIDVKIVNNSNNLLPEYATEGSAGMDLKANLKESITLKPLERKMIPTGIHIQLPHGYEAQIRPRSGMAIKYGISVINTPGTIDEDYIGEVAVLVVNLSNEEYIINHGDRIAQMIINKYERIQWQVVEALEVTERGSGGFGHTGH